MTAEHKSLYDLLAGLEGDDQSYFAVLAGLMSILANREPRDESIWEPDRVIRPASLVDEATAKVSSHKDGLYAMVLEPVQYLEAYLALYRGDIETAKQAADLRKSEGRSARYHNLDVEQIKKVVDPYIQAQVEKIKPGGEAKLVIVGGPYASGKTELPKQSGVDYVLDLDVTRRELSNSTGRVTQDEISMLRPITSAIGERLPIELLKHGASVLIESSMHRRQQALNDPTLNYAKDNKIPIDIYFILRPVTDCLCRNLHRLGRVAPFMALLESMGGMKLLPELVETFPTIARVTLYDYYPLYQAQVGMNPLAFKDDYLQLLEYARADAQRFNIITMRKDLEVQG